MAQSLNLKNARTIGHREGREFQLHTTLSREEYIKHGRVVAQLSTRYAKTADIYAQAWANAYQEPSIPTPKIHNPNSRFCDCNACMSE